MKEERRGNTTQEEQRVLSEDTVEQVMDGRETNNIGAEPRDNVDRDEQHYTRESHLSRGNSRSPLRADSVPTEGFGDVVVDGLQVPKLNLVNTPEDDSSPEIMEKWALDNAPAPIKVKMEGETSEESTPQELSPPPSPKRMREVARKGKVFSQGSI